MTLRGASAILECSAGALLLAGLFTRPVAFILSGHMAFAYFIAHAPQKLLADPQPGRAGDHVLLRVPLPCRAGGGPWSLDSAFRPQKLMREGSRC
jgi:putative oxidoreductase